MTIDQLSTPCALVDLDRLERNAASMSQQARRLGVRLRPHCKTHKCVEAARLQTAAEHGGITVSTLAEAHAFADAGFADITWAVPVALDRLGECAELVRRTYRFRVLVDHLRAVAELEAFAAAHALRFEVLLEVDCGHHRSGVDPDDPASVRLAGAIHSSPDLELAGILTHAGQSYRCGSRAEAAGVARHERDVMAAFAGRLRAAGVPVGDVSVGSTPTVTAAEDLTGVTEVRPGNYLLFDAFQATLGTCATDDCALTVLAAVVSRSRARRSVIVDAGAIALSKDRGPAAWDTAAGYGRVLDLEGRDLGLRLQNVSQEHGEIGDVPASVLDRLPVGTRVRVLANHSCLTAAQHDHFHVLDAGAIVDRWAIHRGW